MKIKLCTLILLMVIFLTACGKSNIDYTQEGNKAYDENNYKNAIKYYKKAIKQNPLNSEAYSKYCGAEYKLLLNNKNASSNKILSICDKAIELDSNNAEAYYLKGNIYHTIDKKYKEAIEEYKKAININNNYAKAYINMSKSYSMLEEYNEALKNLTQAIDKSSNPEDKLLAYSQRGFLYLAKMKEPQLAEVDFKKATEIEISSNNYLLYVERGNANNYLKQYKNALSDMKKAIEIDKKQYIPYIGLAKVKLSKKNYESAIITLNEGIDEIKDSEELYYYRGLFKELLEIEKIKKKEGKGSFKESYDDLTKAEELALKHDNQIVYKQIIDAKNKLNILQKNNSSENSIKPTNVENTPVRKTTFSKSECIEKKSNVLKMIYIDNESNYLNEEVDALYEDCSAYMDEDRNTFLAFAYDGIASQYLEANHYDTAIMHAKLANEYKSCHSIFTLSRIYKKTEDWEDARINLLPCEQKIGKNSSPIVYEVMGKIYATNFDKSKNISDIYMAEAYFVEARNELVDGLKIAKTYELKTYIESEISRIDGYIALMRTIIYEYNSAKSQSIL